MRRSVPLYMGGDNSFLFHIATNMNPVFPARCDGSGKLSVAEDPAKHGDRRAHLAAGAKIVSHGVGNDPLPARAELSLWEPGWDRPRKPSGCNLRLSPPAEAESGRSRCRRLLDPDIPESHCARFRAGIAQRENRGRDSLRFFFAKPLMHSSWAEIRPMRKRRSFGVARRIMPTFSASSSALSVALEMDLVKPFDDFARIGRQPLRFVGRHLNDQQIGGFGRLHQRNERRIGDIAPVPIEARRRSRSCGGSAANRRRRARSRRIIRARRKIRNLPSRTLVAAISSFTGGRPRNPFEIDLCRQRFA